MSIITVWGSPGSGKSVFCCVLARALADNKSRVVIINTDPNLPMMPVWLPGQLIDSNMSVGQLLSASAIDTALTASKVVLLKKYPNIGLLGHVAGETPFSYPEITYDSAQRLISTAAHLVDHLIIDSGSALTNFFTPLSIKVASLVLRVLTPDLKGVNYLKAHQPLLFDPSFRYGEHLNFAGLARPFHAREEMEQDIGGWTGLLPYYKEIERCAIKGDMFEAVGHCGKEYIKSINTVLEAVSGEQFK